jgi:putative spermidine/putrescine transport system permease protein
MASGGTGATAMPSGRLGTSSSLLRVEWLIVPLLIFLAVFYACPIMAMLFRSVSDPVLSLQHYQEIVTTGVIYRVFGITLRIAVAITVIALIVGYPLAYLMSVSSPTVQKILLAIVLVPFWISVLVRSYSWMVLLGRQGPINQTLMFLGMTNEPIRLLNTTLATHLGMLQVLLPFMILPLFNSLRAIDPQLTTAARSLGAPSWRVFRHVIFPLSLPGVGAGCLLVFIISMGFYITPALLGGQRDLMIAILIASQVDQFNWGLASALAATLLTVVLTVVIVLDRWLSIEKIFGSER